MNGPNEQLVRALAGRYEIERELGRGGMAVVYLAHDIRHRRHVAIKVLRPDFANAVGGERFVREIDVAGRLTHPHILPLIDSGDAEGILYYVMPYVAGETLAVPKSLILMSSRSESRMFAGLMSRWITPFWKA